MITPLAPKLFLINGENRGRYPFGNGLLVDTEVRILVDSGFGPSPTESVLAGGDIDIIINTHFHLDHAYGNKYFPKAQIWAHYLDAPPMRSKDEFEAYTGVSLSEDTSFEEFFPGSIVNGKVARELYDGEILDFNGIEFEVVHTPGHTPGHICLYEKNYRILFSGDIDLTSFGPWYGNTLSDIDHFCASIEKLISLKPEVLVSSHAGVIRGDITERLKQYGDIIKQREKEILKQLREAKTIKELIDANIIYPAYQKDENSFQFFAEQTMLGKHLHRLLRHGKVKKKPNDRFKACC